MYNAAVHSSMYSSGPNTPHRWSEREGDIKLIIALHQTKLKPPHRKIRSSPRFPLWLIRIINQSTLLSIQDEPSPRPAVESGAQLVQVSTARRWIDGHMWTQVYLMASCFDVLFQVQIGRHDGQVPKKYTKQESIKLIQYNIHSTTHLVKGRWTFGKFLRPPDTSRLRLSVFERPLVLLTFDTELSPLCVEMPLFLWLWLWLLSWIRSGLLLLNPLFRPPLLL